jgi:hypothetical protein
MHVVSVASEGRGERHPSSFRWTASEKRFRCTADLCKDASSAYRPRILPKFRDIKRPGTIVSRQNQLGFYFVIVFLQLGLIQSILVYAWCYRIVCRGEGGIAGSKQPKYQWRCDKVKSLSLFKHYVMKSEVQLHALTSARGERSSSSRGRFAPKERAPRTSWIGGRVDPSAGLEVMVNDSKYALMMEASSTSETSANFYQTTRRHIVVNFSTVKDLHLNHTSFRMKACRADYNKIWPISSKLNSKGIRCPHSDTV